MPLNGLSCLDFPICFHKMAYGCQMISMGAVVFRQIQLHRKFVTPVENTTS